MVRDYPLPRIQTGGPILAWIVVDTEFPKKGKALGGYGQHCVQLGKQDKCQVAVSISLATVYASLPVAYRFYLPEKCAEDKGL